MHHFHRRFKRRNHENKQAQNDQYPLDFEPVSWENIDESNTTFPQNAFVACKLETGEEGYIAKANVDWQSVTGVTTKNGLVASIPYGSSEHLMRSFSVLTTQDPNNLCWHVDSNGGVSKFAVCGGVDRREQSYIGRTCTPLNDAQTVYRQRLQINHQCDGASRVGKIHPSHRCLYVSYNGLEYVFPRYEVLCHKTSPTTLSAICRWNILQYFQKNEMNIDEAVNKLEIPQSLKKFLTESNKL